MEFKCYGDREKNVFPSTSVGPFVMTKKRISTSLFTKSLQHRGDNGGEGNGGEKKVEKEREKRKKSFSNGV